MSLPPGTVRNALSRSLLCESLHTIPKLELLVSKPEYTFNISSTEIHHQLQCIFTKLWNMAAETYRQHQQRVFYST